MRRSFVSSCSAISPSLTFLSCLLPFAVRVGLGCVFELLDAAYAQIGAHAGHRAEQQRRLAIEIEMLVLHQRRDADQVALLPVPALSIVDVVAAAFEDQQLLLGGVAVTA